MKHILIKDLYENVYSSFTHKSSKLDTAQMHINKGMVNKLRYSIYTMQYNLAMKKKKKPNIYMHNMGESQRHDAKDSYTKIHILYGSTYIKF